MCTNMYPPLLRLVRALTPARPHFNSINRIFTHAQIASRVTKSGQDITEKMLNGENGADGTCTGSVWTGLNSGLNRSKRGIGVPCG